jgi:hypothetical protein
MKNNTHCKVRIGTLEEGVAGFFESNLVSLAESKNLELEIFENNDFDDFVSQLSSGKIDVIIVPNKNAFTIAGLEKVRGINNFEESLNEIGAPKYSFGPDIYGVALDKIESTLLICTDRDDELEEFLLLLVLLLLALCGDKEKEVKPIDKNSFEWEINGTDTISAEDAQTCTLQTYQVRFRAENAKLQHIIWNKKPPVGGRSVERTAIDDKGDAPDGKVPSKANLEEGTWKVPFCSPGQFILTVTVIWICLINKQVHMETKTLTITAKDK